MATTKQKQPVWPVMRIVGKNIFLIFSFVTFLVVAVLAATNVVSKYALMSYTEDQIGRFRWDGVVYQTKDVWEVENLQKALNGIAGISKTERVGIIKLAMGTQLAMKVGGAAVPLPWCVILSPNDPSRLPPQLRSSSGEVTLAFLSPQTILRSSMTDRASQFFQINYLDARTKNETPVFGTPFGHITQPERLEIVKWFLDEFGSGTFIPDQSVIVVLPKEKFDQELPRVFRLVNELSKPEAIVGNPDEGKGQTEPEGENLAASMFVEVMHLLSVDRSKLFSGWDLEGSRDRTSALIQNAATTAKRTSFESFVSSDLLVTLEKMSQVSRLVGLLTILISIPILWMAWHFTASLTRLVILNQRRLIGLLRLRGVSYSPIRQSLRLAIGMGGLLGGLAGALVGTLLPYGLYRISGVRIPLDLLFITVQNPWFLAAFIVLGTTFSVLAGRKIIDYMAQITPLEASRRMASSEASLRFEFTTVHLFSLFVGGTKMAAWIIGYTPQTELLQRADMLLNFVAVPLFIYGVSALIVSRTRMLHAILDGLAHPVTGPLKWFAVTDMLSRPQRVMSTILVAALAFVVVVYPRVTADSFYEKALRGLRLNLGSDVAVRFDGATLTGGDLKAETIEWYAANVGRRVQEMEGKIKAMPGVRDVHAIYELSVPGTFYIPGKNYLQLYLIEDPEKFIRSVYYENRLGADRPFEQLVTALKKDELIISKGFASSFDSGDVRAKLLGIGRSASGSDVTSPIAGITYLLPGTPQLVVANRESYASAAVEFLNSISEINPYVVGRLNAKNLGPLNAFLTGVFLDVSVGDGNPDTITTLLHQLNKSGALPEIAAISTIEGESGKLGNDMFVRLGLENMKVFLIGGILVSLSAVIAIAIVNFIERRRTFGILRIRGASPAQLMRVVLAQMMVPVLIGGAIGVLAGLAAGYGLTNAIFSLPRVISILGILDVHLTVRTAVAGIVAGVLGIFFLATLSLSSWIFRRSAREALKHD